MKISNNDSVKFGTLPNNVREVINQPKVKRILLREYNIKKSDISKLKSSELGFSLLSKHPGIRDFNLPKEAGLLINPPADTYLSRVCVSVPEANLEQADAHFFAFCIKKAIEMEKVFRRTSKQITEAPELKSWETAIDRRERRIKIALRDYKDNYNYGDNWAVNDDLFQQIERYQREERKIDAENAPNFELAKKRIAKVIFDKWQQIGGMKMEEPFKVAVN